MAHLSDGGEYGGSKWHTCQVEASMEGQSNTLAR